MNHDIVVVVVVMPLPRDEVRGEEMGVHLPDEVRCWDGKHCE